VNGKTLTESFRTEAVRPNAERETSEYRKWQQLIREFVDVNAAICGLLPLTGKKKQPRRSNKTPRMKEARCWR